MVKTLPKVIYHGAKLFLKSIHKSILEEIQLSKEAARIRYKERSVENASANIKEISLNEAMRILNIDKLCPKEVEEKYKHLLQANSESQSGSFYLQSKVFRAKERIDQELNNIAIKNDFVNISNK